jgi:thiol-disulfide isomerase/thioredoxin
MSADRAARIVATAAIVTCAIVVGGTVLILVTPAARAAVSDAFEGGQPYETGRPIDLSPAAFQPSSPTTVFFVRSSCGACREAVPIFQTLVREIAGHPSWRALVVTDRRDRNAATYAELLGARQADVIQVDFATLRLRRVPTVVVVDGSGLVRFAHEGPPDPSGESTLVAAVLEKMTGIQD